MDWGIKAVPRRVPLAAVSQLDLGTRAGECGRGQPGIVPKHACKPYGGPGFRFRTFVNGYDYMISTPVTFSNSTSAHDALATPSTAVLAGLGASISIGYQVLLPVAPVLLERLGPHGAAGAATAGLFLATVVGELLTPWLMSQWSASRILIASQLLTAVASLVYLFPHVTAWQMLAAAGARGLGIGIAIVVCVALVAELAPPNRRGRS